MVLEEKLASILPHLKINPEEYPTGTMAPPFWRTYTKKGYSPHQRIVAEYFFTNLQGNVYGAKSGRMPDELWAFLIGRYSRSSVSLRDKFLGIFEEMQKEKEELLGSGKTLAEEDYVTLKDLAEQVQKSSAVNLNIFLRRAQTFLGRWANDNCGHDSLRDADILRFAVEGISQLSTKFLEAASLGAYQEQSTRYINFKQRELVISPSLKNSQYSAEIKNFFSRMMQRYEKALTKVKMFVEEKIVEEKNFSVVEDYQRAVKGKTLDIVRYFLPLSAQTSLGITMPTREAKRHLSWLLSQPLEELQLLGYSLLKEGLKLSPILLEHVNVNNYELKRTEQMRQLAKKHNLVTVLSKFIAGKEKPLLSTPSGITSDCFLAAAYLYEASNLRFEEVLYRARNLTSEELHQIHQAYTQDRGAHDELGKAAGINWLNFDCTLDIGAYRDLARHRRCLQLRQKFTPELGYEFPEFLEDASELSAVKEDYLRSLDESLELYQKVQLEVGDEAQYLSLMGHKINFLLSVDPREADFIVELRSRLGGHYSYRTLVQEMYWLLKKEMPLFTETVRVHLE